MNAADETVKWRCLRARPKCEHLAAKHLLAAEFEAFAPRIRHQRRTVRGRVWFVEALFPGYLFARFAPVQARHVASIPFVSHVLSFMEDCGSVPDGVIAELRSAVAEDETITVPDQIAAGDVVDVVSGPLRGQSATVTRALPGHERVRILLEFLGQPHEVEVSILTLLSGRDARAAALPARA